MKDNTGNAASTETRRLAAIMFTDIVGFSRQMGRNEAHTLRLLAVHNDVIHQAVAVHHGTVIKTVGDGFLVDFPSVVHAVQCAQQIQTQFRVRNEDKERTDQIHVRIGIHLGDIVQQDGDVFGDGVNVASRLQGLAKPDTICISHVVYNEVEKKLVLGAVVPLGRPQLKNIAQRQNVYLLPPEPPKGLRQRLQVQRLKLSRQVRPAYRALAVALLLIVVSIVTTHYFLVPPPHTPDAPPPTQPSLPLPDKPSIVVLPFANMSKDPEQDYFSNGITGDITSSLSKISSLFVIDHNSARIYKDKVVKVQDVSREMGVRYVLEGSVRKAADQVRITAQLIDAPTGEHLWSERFDRPFKDIFALQDEIVQKIVTTLKLQLTLQEQGLIVRKTTDNLEAYDYVLRGVESFGRYTIETTVQARLMFEKAVALDPQYAEAYMWLGSAYSQEWILRRGADPQILERALALAQQALALDDSLPGAHSLLGVVYAQKQQYDQAIAEGERAIALNPNNSACYMVQANVLNWSGRAEEAISMAEQAMRLSPHYPSGYLFQLGWAYRLTGRYDEAIATVKEVVRRSPDLVPGYLNLAFGYMYQWAYQQHADAQTLEQAMAAAQRIIALNNSDPLGHALLGVVSLWQKQYEQAIAEGERAITLNPNLADSYAALAETLSRVGKSEDALRMAEQALLHKPWVAAQHLNSVGIAYDLAGKPEEAIAPLKQFLSHYPNILGAHLTLAAVYSELGKETEAHTEAAEVLRLNPQFSLEVHQQRAPIKDPTTLERHVAVLSKAGLK